MMDDRSAARQIAAIFGRSCREPGNDPGLDPALDSAAEVVASIRAETRAEAPRGGLMDRFSAKDLTDPIREALEQFPPGDVDRECAMVALEKIMAILADEPKEREADENNCPMIEAWVWPSGEWKIQAASAQQWKEHGIFQIVPIFSRAEVERKLKEARP